MTHSIRLIPIAALGLALGGCSITTPPAATPAPIVMQAPAQPAVMVPQPVLVQPRY
jgi:hypothetical protein